MKKKLKIIVVSLIVVGASLLAIYIFSEGKKREVKNIVITYNDVLRKAHLEMNASLLSRLTSEKQLKKVDSYIAFNLKNGRIIDGELRDLQFQDIIIQENSAIVVTIERWGWVYMDPGSKKPVSEMFDDVYGNTYSLVRTGGHWVVDDIDSNVIDASPKE
ncbi:MAG: hypothetical protein C4538_04965 [Nitrospiraceae bacterium]|nr:MAG: hypothetical protein C4538_04965 [Nitrospiraceae bacterium]